MVYGSEAIFPVEIEQSSIRVEHYDEDNSEARPQELDFVEERREKESVRMEAYRDQVMKAYNKRFYLGISRWVNLFLRKPIQSGDVGKMEAKCEGPYKVIKKVSSEALYLKNDEGRPLKRPLNAFYLKKYYS